MNKSDFLAKTKKIIVGLMPEVAIIIGGFLLDIISKYIVQGNMQVGDSVTLIPKLLNITYVLNKRAAFGNDLGLTETLGEGGVLAFFIIISIITVGFFAFFLFKRPRKGLLYRISFAMIIAGALGNLYDRIFCGFVRDFIEFEYLGLTIFGQKSFAIFNIADSFVVVGAILLIIFFIFFDKTFKEQPSPAEGEQTAQIDSQAEADEAKDESQPHQMTVEDYIAQNQEADDEPDQTDVEQNQTETDITESAGGEN